MSDKQRIKALWFASWWPRPDHPVLGIFTKRDAEAVASYCDLVVVSAIHHADNQFIIEEVINNEGFREVVVYCPTGNIVTHKLNLAMGYYKAFKWIYDKGFKSDIIHLHIVSIAGLAALFFNKIYKIPIFLSENWSGFSLENPPIGFFKKWLGKRIASQSSSVFVVTGAMANTMRRIGWNGRYIINPNLVNTDFFVPAPFLLNSSLFRFIHISSLDDEHKNIIGLLRAAYQVALQQPNFLLTIIGGDEGTAHVAQMARSLGLLDKLRILGVQSIEVVRQEMQESHAFVLFSNREGLPCVILEAMSTGLPVISSDVPGLEDWVTKETGILVPRCNEAALATAMLKVMDGYHHFDKSKIREKIVKECSYAVVGKRIATAYEAEVASARKRS